MKTVVFLALAFVGLLSVRPAFAACKNPIGPELATKQIGNLLRAYPIGTQTNPLSSVPVGTTIWACKYKVGRALITVNMTTQPNAPMPCKFKVEFQ